MSVWLRLVGNEGGPVPQVGKMRRAPRNRPVRMEEVARRAGVSQMTVSRALRDPNSVAPQTLSRVRTAIRDTGYLQNRIAGGLAAERTHIIGLVASTLNNPLMGQVVQGVCEALAQTGYQLMLGMAGDPQDAEEQIIRDFLSYRPAGLILHRTSHSKLARQWLLQSGIPVVETGNMIAHPIDSVVSFSNYRAAQKMTAYLASRYRRIGYIGNLSASDDRFKARRRGYRDALTAAGHIYDRQRVVELSFSGPSGGEGLAQLLERCPDTDAVLFTNGTFAIDAMVECRRRGWQVPQRVAIASFDDYELVVQSISGITAVRIPRYEIGRRASEVILDRLNGRDDRPARVEFDFEIVRRNSA